MTATTIPSLLDYAAYFIDLDGTIYLGKRPFPKVKETLQTLRSLGKRLLFLTNDASLRREHIAIKLQKMGIAAATEEIINPSLVAIRYLRQHYPQAPLFVIGEGDLPEELAEAGLPLSENPQHIQTVLVSTDHHFSYRKLKIAFRAIRNGAILLATNADRTYPNHRGEEVPDAGALIAAIEACTAHPLDVLLGKPAHFMAELALQTVALPPTQCLLIGDNPETDIRMGKHANIPTALVRSGIGKNSHFSLPAEHPDYMLNQFADLLSSTVPPNF